MISLFSRGTEFWLRRNLAEYILTNLYVRGVYVSLMTAAWAKDPTWKVVVLENTHIIGFSMLLVQNVPSHLT